jgi:PRC-barrel domain
MVVPAPARGGTLAAVIDLSGGEGGILAQATAHADRSLISSEDVVGTDVYGVGDEAIGEVDHLLIEKVSGRVAYAVMSFGGFLGLAHSHYPIPWSALKYDTALGGFRTGITESQLKDAPEFSDDSWGDREWETRTHEHYGARPYWGA